jgi:hypothetical protein
MMLKIFKKKPLEFMTADQARALATGLESKLYRIIEHILNKYIRPQAAKGLFSAQIRWMEIEMEFQLGHNPSCDANLIKDRLKNLGYRFEGMRKDGMGFYCIERITWSDDEQKTSD